jgi:hypothetical protein
MGAAHSDTGMASFRVVRARYPVEDGGGKLVAGLPLFGVE